MSVHLPEPPDAVQMSHKLMSLPMKAMSALGVGPFGGKSSVSVLIEALVRDRTGKPITFNMSKTDRFLFEQFRKADASELVEYRELNHEAQRVVLERHAAARLGVIWLGGGVFTLEHPFLSAPGGHEHIWTDADEFVVEEAEALYRDLRARQQSADNPLTYRMILPQDAGLVNNTVNFLVNQTMQRIVFQVYGLSYALTMHENHAWMRQLTRPSGVPFTFIFNAPDPEKINPRGLVAAAMDDQKMLVYKDEHISALFKAVFGTHEIVWSKPHTATKYGIWSTWVIDVPAVR